MSEKYSIPIFENGKKTVHTVEGTVGDAKYIELIKLSNGKTLPDAINVNVKK